MKKNQVILLKNYDQLLAEIRNQIDVTKTDIANVVTRQKVVMAWQIGKLISEHLDGNTKRNYSDQLFRKLENDVGITKTVLYKMHAFYESYPKLPKDDSKLNWSHYRVLSGIKVSSERKYLESLAKEKNWNTDTLQREVKKSKISQIRENNAARKKVSIPKNLVPRRGKLFCYSLVKPKNLSHICIDCGFKIFRNLQESLPKNLQGRKQIVETVKKNKDYSLQKSSQTAHKLNVYKAYVSRVVDGDTIHVTLDLGFEIFHEEILRLRGIDAPERETVEGKKSTDTLRRILKNIPFLIVKTTATDIYGRYVADVFLADAAQKNDAQKVADKGVYLNQLLLDRGAAVLV